MTQFSSPWYSYIPTVNRYLGQQSWVDDFLNTGKIRLAAFREFRTHSDEVRRDATDGLFNNEHTFFPPEGSGAKPLFIHASGDIGRRSYVLCASLRQDLKKFGDSFFTIENTTAFAREISRQLPGFMQGWEGLCMYGRHRNTKSEVTAAVAAAVHEKLEARQFPELPPLDFSVMFAKPMQHAEELEYRMVFEVDREVTEATFVNAPRARYFCRRPEKHDADKHAP